MKWANRKMGKRRRNKEESARSGTKVICPLFSVDITLMDLKVNHQACKKKQQKGKVLFFQILSHICTPSVQFFFFFAWYLKATAYLILMWLSLSFYKCKSVSGHVLNDLLTKNI